MGARGPPGHLAKNLRGFDERRYLKDLDGQARQERLEQGSIQGPVKVKL